MGILQPGGAGTPVYVYDDAVNTNHPAAPGPHTWAEISAAFPLAVAPMQDAAANIFSVLRVQYLLNVPVVIGGQVTDGGNYTSIVDSLVDLFCKTTGVLCHHQYRSDPGISPANIVTTYGKKVGVGTKMAGHSGVSIHAGGGAGRIDLLGTVGLYGCHIEGQGAIRFTNQGSGFQEVASCIVDSSGSMILGNAASGPLTLYNSVLCYRGTGNAVIGVEISDSSGVILVATAPATFFSSGTANRKIRRLTLSGAVTTADISTGAADWEVTDLTWSDTPGKPRLNLSGSQSLADALIDYRSYDVKMIDPLGNSIQAMPIQVSTDVEGLILETQTGADGNVVFTWNPTGVANVLPVREYYVSGGVQTTRDRLYTALVNGYGGTFSPLPGFATVKFNFTWPGRDRLGSGYQVNGGSFQKVMDVIQVPFGTPSTQAIWVPCEVIV